MLQTSDPRNIKHYMDCRSRLHCAKSICSRIC